MPLLDTLQGGYPAVQAGQGRSLLDLLTALGRTDGTQPQTMPQSIYAMGTPDPMAALPQQAAPGLLGPMGFSGGGLLQAGMQSAPASAASPMAQQAPVNQPAIQIAAASGQPDVTVDDQGNASDAWQPNANGGGLISALAPAAVDASQSPQKAKTLLGALGATISGIGDKLTNLSPNASQSLIASGLTMLAGNDGSRNLGQLVGLGGIAGLNTYNANREQQTQNALALQKLQQQSSQQGFDNTLAARKQLWEEGKPVSVGQDQSLIDPRTGRAIVQAQPGVARTTDVQGPDGNTYTVQLDRNGNIVGQPLLKSNPNIGPLGDQQQKTVNDAQQSAAAAKTTYQNTAYLANQLASAPDFSSGFGASINDTLTRVTGNKDAGQQLRGQLAQFANNSILGELPPGSASDKDIQLVRNGVPSDTASKTTWQAYFSAVGRVQQAAALYQNAKADFVTTNRGDLGPLKRDATINGVQYPAGTTFAQAVTGNSPQTQSTPSTGAVPLSSLQAEARRRGLIK